MKKSKYIVTFLVPSLAITLVIVAVVLLGSGKTNKQQPSEEIQIGESSRQPGQQETAQEKAEELNPLPSNSSLAVDTEINYIYRDLNDIRDENLDDLSGIENSY